MDEQTVAITGMGLVTALGRGVGANWAAVEAGRTALATATNPDLPAWLQCVARVEGAALPEDIPTKLLSQSKFLNRGGVLAVLAALEAVAQAAPPEAVPPAERCLYVATGDHTQVGYEFLYPATKEASGGRFLEADAEKLNKATIEKVTPFYLLESLNNNPFSFLTALFSFMGPGTSFASLSPCGAQALEMCVRNVRHGRAKVALAVGSGSWVNEITLYELAHLGLLSKARRGPASFRPFDRRRDGFLPGEGAAALVLEPLEQARERGATVLGLVRGLGASTDAAPGLALPDRVAERSMAEALADAGWTAADLGFVCPHGSGTAKGDRAELRGVAGVLGDRRAGVPVCALKPYTGHMGAASDLAEVILGVRAAAAGVAPGTLHFEAADPEFGDVKISARPQPCARPRLLSVSYGLGGQSSAVTIEACPEAAARA
jgi:3-oxoacyl-[acyl-carrier-protein] synthase II